MIFLTISTMHIRDQILPLPLSLCKYPGNSGSADVRISGLHPFLSCVGKALSARAVPADATLCGGVSKACAGCGGVARQQYCIPLESQGEEPDPLSPHCFLTPLVDGDGFCTGIFLYT